MDIVLNQLLMTYPNINRVRDCSTCIRKTALEKQRPTTGYGQRIKIPSAKWNRDTTHSPLKTQGSLQKRKGAKEIEVVGDYKETVF